MLLLDFTKEEYQKWLSSLDPQKPVGYFNPLCSFVVWWFREHQPDYPEVFVYPTHQYPREVEVTTTIGEWTENLSIVLPEWTKPLVEKYWYKDLSEMLPAKAIEDMILLRMAELTFDGVFVPNGLPRPLKGTMQE